MWSRGRSSSRSTSVSSVVAARVWSPTMPRPSARAAWNDEIRGFFPAMSSTIGIRLATPPLSRVSAR